MDSADSPAAVYQPAVNGQVDRNVDGRTAFHTAAIDFDRLLVAANCCQRGQVTCGGGSHRCFRSLRDNFGCGGELYLHTDVSKRVFSHQQHRSADNTRHWNRFLSAVCDVGSEVQ